MKADGRNCSRNPKRPEFIRLNIIHTSLKFKSRANSWRFLFCFVFSKKKELILRLTSTETVRLIRDGGGGGGMEVGAEVDYIPIATVTTRMTSALRWAAMRAILRFQ